MKFYGNIVLMTVICIVVFWMFMALRPAQAFGGCGSSWAICRYRIWVRHHTPAEYQARQQRNRAYLHSRNSVEGRLPLTVERATA